MTKEPIMIDDIDVSGCDYYANTGECANENVYPDYCNACSNCKYKLEQQLKRKEQECEKIKNWVKGMMFYTDCSNWFERFTTAFEDWKNDLTSQLNQLKVENEHLSEKEKEARHYLEEAYNYKQALQEIKEMCKQKLPAGLSTPSCYESFEAFTGYILQKCEVINEQN